MTMVIETKDRRRERLDRGIKVRTDGIYAISSWKEIAYLLAPRVLLIGGLLIAPLLLTQFPYWQRVLSFIAI
jgi:branched-chain amino acid transport system permease protein